MHTKIAQLPSPPAWKSRIVTVPGGTTVTPLKLLFRDGLEVFKFLFANPVFTDHQNFAPKTVWADYENDIRIFDEPPTGSYMFEVQVCHGSKLSRSYVTLTSFERERLIRARRWDWSSSVQIKRTSRTIVVIRKTTAYTCRAEISAKIYERRCHQDAG